MTALTHSLITRLTDLRRPRMLIRAAKAGGQVYRRKAVLRRLSCDSAGTPERLVSALLEKEADMDALRRTRAATYSLAHHVEVLVALMAEAHALTSNA